MRTTVLFLLLFIGSLSGQTIRGASVQSSPVLKQNDGFLVAIGDTKLKLEVVTDNVIHVMAAKDDSFFSRKSIVAVPKTAAPSPSGWMASLPASCVSEPNEAARQETRQESRVLLGPRSPANWTLSTAPNVATLITTKLKARVNLTTGTITFLDSNGRTILAEQGNGRSITPAEVQGEKTFHVRQQWQLNPDESLYGLGQRQMGMLDIKGYDLDLWQHNTHVVIPFLVSSRGYGLLWDNTSFTRFGDLRPFELIPAACLRDANGQPGGLTVGTFTADHPDQLQNPTVATNVVLESRRSGSRVITRWMGEMVPSTTGDYQFQTYSNGGIKVWIDKRLVIDHWRQNWLTDHDQVKIHLKANHHYPIQIESGGDQTTTMQLLWKTPPSPQEAGSISLWSEVGDGIDYYFVYGPELDKVVAGYRRITGPGDDDAASGRSASGNRGSATRRRSSDSTCVDGFRSRSIPFDNIVQDWQYWPRDNWGSHEFDPQRFPDPDGWIKCHPRQTRPPDDLGLGQVLSGHGQLRGHAEGQGFLYRPNLTEGLRDWVGRLPYTFYDAFNPEARQTLLVADQHRPVPQGDRRLVDGRHRAGPDTAAANARRTTHPHAPDRAGLRLAHAQRVLAREQRGRLRRPARLWRPISASSS